MARPVYSLLMIARTGLVGTAQVQVPPGLLYVLRDLDLYNGGGLTPTTAFLHGSDGQTIFTANSSTAQTLAEWRGRQVIPAGATFDVTTTGAWDVSLSGYALQLP